MKLKLKKLTNNTIEDTTLNAMDLSVLENTLWEQVENGKLTKALAEELFVQLGGVKIQAICAPYFDLDEVRPTLFPQITKDIARLLMRSGIPRVYAKEFAESMMACVSNFVQTEKRVIARRRRQKNAA